MHDDDDLELYIAARDAARPGFRRRVDDALQRQSLGRELATLRRAMDASQTQVAARMGTSASIVSRLEAGSDVRISTLEKYSAALGVRLDIRVLPASARISRAPAVRASGSTTKVQKRVAKAAKRSTGKQIVAKSTSERPKGR